MQQHTRSNSPGICRPWIADTPLCVLLSNSWLEPAQRDTVILNPLSGTPTALVDTQLLAWIFRNRLQLETRHLWHKGTTYIRLCSSINYRMEQLLVWVWTLYIELFFYDNTLIVNGFVMWNITVGDCKHYAVTHVHTLMEEVSGVRGHCLAQGHFDSLRRSQSH